MNFLLLLLLGYIGFAILLRWREPAMIYYPTRELAPPPPGYEDITLTTADGETINGWFLPAGRSAPFTVLFFHGNAGNLSHRSEKWTTFHDLGADVFIIDYRGYGRSTGRPDEQGTYRDAQAAYDYLTKQRRLSPAQIVVYGESLGSAVAVDLATKVPVAAVIIEEPFTSIGDVGQKMFPFIPVRWIVHNQYDSLAKIGQLRAPLLIFHSRDDELFPLTFAQRLLAAAPPPKQLIELRGRHNDAFLVSAEVYRSGLQNFFAGLPRR